MFVIFTVPTRGERGVAEAQFVGEGPVGYARRPFWVCAKAILGGRGSQLENMLIMVIMNMMLMTMMMTMMMMRMRMVVVMMMMMMRMTMTMMTMMTILIVFGWY